MTFTISIFPYRDMSLRFDVKKQKEKEDTCNEFDGLRQARISNSVWRRRDLRSLSHVIYLVKTYLKEWFPRVV